MGIVGANARHANTKTGDEEGVKPRDGSFGGEVGGGGGGAPEEGAAQTPEASVKHQLHIDHEPVVYIYICICMYFIWLGFGGLPRPSTSC